MIALVIIYLLFCISLISILMETKMNFYKNARFWTLFLAFIFLVSITGMSFLG